MSSFRPALTTLNEVRFSDRHGVSGYHIPNSRAALQNEIAIFHTGGILPKLCEQLNQPIRGKESYNLEQLLYNIAFIHRAFVLTYPGRTELFLPLKGVEFVKKVRSKEAWIQAEVSAQYASSHMDRMLPPGWERDAGMGDKIVLRRKSRFKWNGRKLTDSKERLEKYHRVSRRKITPIHATRTRWYLRKEVADLRVVNRTQVALVFAAMHRLSELSRYVPGRLAKHMDGKQNWLLTEFLRMAPAQFVYAIASEMTGREFIRTSSYDISNTPTN